ncbi:hypothetical protein FRX31_022072, partial [Thalictrum thalictroides]
MGDYNETLFQWEKWNSPIRNFPSSRALSDLFDMFCLSDVGFNGVTFTWSNGQPFQKLSKSRLDK